MKKRNERMRLHKPELTVAVGHMYMDLKKKFNDILKHCMVYCRRQECPNVQNAFGIWIRQDSSWSTSLNESLHRRG